MFTKLKWAFALRIKPVEKVILLALVKMADHDGKSYPSIRTLARLCCVSERTVQRALKRFEANGWLKIEARWRLGLGQSSNRYQLLIADPENDPHTPVNLTPGLRPTDRSEVTQPCHSPDVTAVSPQELPRELSIEDVVREQVVDNRRLRMPEQFKANELADAATLLHGIARDTAQLLLDEVSAAMSLPGVIKTTPIRFLRGLIQRHQTGDFKPYLSKHLTAYAKHSKSTPEAAKSAERSTAAANIKRLKQMLKTTTSTPATERPQAHRQTISRHKAATPAQPRDRPEH